MQDDYCCIDHDFDYNRHVVYNYADRCYVIEIKSFQAYAIDESRSDEDRLSPGSALLVVLGLSLLGWAVILAPFVAIFHK